LFKNTVIPYLFVQYFYPNHWRPLLHAPPSTPLPLIFRLLCFRVYIPTLYDEPVDQKRELEDRCKAPCTRPLKEYQVCAKRIQGDESGHKHCTGQYFDYWRCIDNCAATKLFSHLK
ncbi:cytochrome b-c1 complex subunit 6-1, mitochondrial-like, partial [Primulina eburnea]|uniref:cytochrome b-c1 complex subunit 6-1, mitochondrial-like n=1 Tax=Primulina eburnea TaxID=1245227 RepID=UPI003C6C1C19